MNKSPSLSEVMAAATGKKPLPGPAEPIQAPAPNVLVPTIPTEILVLAKLAAEATDQEREAKLRGAEARSELSDAMKAAGIDSIPMEDRKPIAFTSSTSKQATMGAIKSVLGDATGKKVWDSLPTKTSTSLNIPKPSADEPDE